MCLQRESKELLEEEKLVQVEINNCINEFKNIKFNAGAGAGKTHALKESLIYIINEYSDKLHNHNQEVLCITYTNVATKEIKERLGNSTLVNVSTIHERVWELIKGYQDELVIIHKENVSSLLKKLEEDIKDSSKKDYKEFQSLEEKEQKEFISLMENKRDFFYKNRDKKVGELRELFSDVIDDFPNCIKTKTGFLNTVKIIYKINNYSECIKRIDLKEKKYTNIFYDSQQNNDSLHRMRISHDTLLEYGLEIIKKYDLLKQIIVNKYPYILVDEYQDTAENVVEILSLLDAYSKKINYQIFIGYFGDTAQNIYEDGVGEKIDHIHSGLESVNKQFNRRSAQEIIDVINKIRNDEISQKSIYEDKNCGTVGFYQGDIEKVDEFIELCKSDWNIDMSNKLHCLVLKNELVAKYNGFSNIYNCFKKTKYYSGVNYQALNTELVTNDIRKLGDVPNILYKIIELKQNLENLNTPITDILKEEIYKDFSFNNLFDLINLLKSISGNTLKEYIESLFFEYNKEPKIKGMKEKVDDLFKDIKVTSYNDLFSFLFEKLERDINDDKKDAAKENLNNLLSIDMNEFNKWFDFINEIEKNDLIYHTYHGTKGNEFDNVLIIMENKFRVKDKFSSYFTNIKNPDLYNEQFINTRNLLYVSCSRAIKNLRIFYLDDTSDFKDSIENIFGNILDYNH